MTAPSRRPVTARVLDVAERPGVYRIEFTPEEVGTHLIDVSISNFYTTVTLLVKIEFLLLLLIVRAVTLRSDRCRTLVARPISKQIIIYASNTS